MQTSFSADRHADYLGVDPSDRYAKHRRPIDVCGLFLQKDGRLEADFWQWHWGTPGPLLNVQAILGEILAARTTLVDGPQALASPGMSMRAAERLCAAAGKTPDHVPKSGPYSGFIRSSLELFAACAAAGVAVGPVDAAGAMAETYPGSNWRRLAPGLPKKHLRAGRRSRKAVLELLGVGNLPDDPSHDQLDACLCALLAAAADGKVAGIRVQSFGQPLHQSSDGIWREGTIIGIEHAPILHPAPTQTAAREAAAVPRPSFTDEQRERAQALGRELVECCKAGAAQLCTYAWAYQQIFARTPARWSQAYARQVIAIARATPALLLQGLGPVKLDTFIVTSSNHLPSTGHWATAPYTPKQWNVLFAHAQVRQPDRS